MLHGAELAGGGRAHPLLPADHGERRRWRGRARPHPSEHQLHGPAPRRRAAATATDATVPLPSLRSPVHAPAERPSPLFCTASTRPAPCLAAVCRVHSPTFACVLWHVRCRAANGRPRDGDGTARRGACRRTRPARRVRSLCSAVDGGAPPIPAVPAAGPMRHGRPRPRRRPDRAGSSRSSSSTRQGSSRTADRGQGRTAAGVRSSPAAGAVRLDATPGVADSPASPRPASSTPLQTGRAVSVSRPAVEQHATHVPEGRTRRSAMARGRAGGGGRARCAKKRRRSPRQSRTGTEGRRGSVSAARGGGCWPSRGRPTQAGAHTARTCPSPPPPPFSWVCGQGGTQAGRLRRAPRRAT